MKTEKKKWEKPELVVLAKGELGENILTGCYQEGDGSWNYTQHSS